MKKLEKKIRKLEKKISKLEAKELSKLFIDTGPAMQISLGCGAPENNRLNTIEPFVPRA